MFRKDSSTITCTIVSATIIVVLLLPSTSTAQDRNFSFGVAPAHTEIQELQAEKVAEDMVLFGTPPDDDIIRELANLSNDSESRTIAEYDVAGGWVRFVDEGDSVSTIVKGGRETFAIVAGAGTVGELFYSAAPKGTTMPWEIANVSRESLDMVLTAEGHAGGPTLEQEFEYGYDDWSDGCSADEQELWESHFHDWHGPWTENFAFSTTDFWDFGSEPIGNAYGYFGNLDEIWFAVCSMNHFGSTQIHMEQLVVSPCENSVCGIWEQIPGTSATLGSGERYLYHNYSIYSPFRRSSINPIGSKLTGWKYFISGAGSDSFLPDDQWSPN